MAGFRRFLLDFSQMERHEIPSLVIWEHYLVYAVTWCSQSNSAAGMVFPICRKGITALDMVGITLAPISTLQLSAIL